MTSYPALEGLRLGCVQYLNARPLICAYGGPVVFDHPSGLARDISRGALDVALVPIFEALREPHYQLVDDVAIASDGPVYSVFLAYRGELSDLRTIALDPASLTSVHLLRVLLAEYHGLHPQFIDASSIHPDARLLIGNQAIAYRAHDKDATILDLGEEWKRCIGHPFVYATWLLRPGLAYAEEIADSLRALKRNGVARIPKLIHTEAACDPAFCERYLTRHIRFDLGPREKAGIEEFRRLLAKHHHIHDGTKPLHYV